MSAAAAHCRTRLRSPLKTLESLPPLRSASALLMQLLHRSRACLSVCLPVSHSFNHSSCLPAFSHSSLLISSLLTHSHTQLVLHITKPPARVCLRVRLRRSPNEQRKYNTALYSLCTIVCVCVYSYSSASISTVLYVSRAPLST